MRGSTTSGREKQAWQSPRVRQLRHPAHVTDAASPALLLLPTYGTKNITAARQSGRPSCTASQPHLLRLAGKLQRPRPLAEFLVDEMLTGSGALRLLKDVLGLARVAIGSLLRERSPP